MGAECRPCTPHSRWRTRLFCKAGWRNVRRSVGPDQHRVWQMGSLTLQAHGSRMPPLHPSFALEDPTILQGRVAKRPEIGRSGPAPRLADGKPDLTGPWEPNAAPAPLIRAGGPDYSARPGGETSGDR